MNGTHTPDCDCFDCDVRYDRRISGQKLSKILNLSMSKIEKDRHFGKGIPFEKVGRNVRYRARTVREYLESRTRRSTSAPIIDR